TAGDGPAGVQEVPAFDVGGFGGVPGLDRPGDARQRVFLGDGGKIAQIMLVILGYGVEQILRRGGEDDVDIGRAVRFVIDTRAGRQRDIFEVLGDERGRVRILADNDWTDAALPARDLAGELGRRGEIPAEIVIHFACTQDRHV